LTANVKKRFYGLLAAVCLTFASLPLAAQEYEDMIVGREAANENSSNAPESEIAGKRRLLTQAKKVLILGDALEAERLYLEIMKTDPKCDVCYYELANILLNAGDYVKATEYAEAAYELDSDNPWFTLLYARLSFRRRDFTKSRLLFRHILRYHSDKQDVWTSLASSYEEEGLFREAFNVLDSTVMRFGENDDITYRLHNIHIALGNLDKALECAEKLSESYPEDPRFLTLLADTYSMVKNDSMAVATYDKAIERSVSFPEAFVGKAEHFRRQGQFAKYFKVMQKFCASRFIDPGIKADYLERVFKIPSFATHFKSDIDTLMGVLSSINPASPELKMLQAYYFVNTERQETALALLNQLTNMNSNSKDAWSGLLSLEYGMKMYAQLEMSSKRAIESDPQDASYYLYSTLSLWSLNKVKQAIAVMETGLKRAYCDSAFLDNAYSLLGDMYFSLDKPKKAFVYYEKALGNNACNAMVLNNYAYYLCLKSKKLDKAYEMSKKAVELDNRNSSFLDTFAYILYLQGKYAEAKAVFRQAIAAGGNESATVLDHYADTLDKLGERNTAEIYWSQALERPDCANPGEIKKKLKKQ
jgi:tetratricopeptide (TPR) repeat protein